MRKAEITIAPKKLNTSVTIAPTNCSTVDISALKIGDIVGEGFEIVSGDCDTGIFIAKKDSRLYAVKVFEKKSAPNKDIQKFLFNNHNPHITRLVTYGEMATYHYEVYDYYNQGTLGKVLSIREIREVIVPCINDALNTIHSNNIIHCDIKPSNIYFSEDKSCVLIGDFGISLVMNTDGSAIVKGYRGTPEYAPLINSRNEEYVYTSAYDYGSLGLVLYKLATGESYLTGKTDEDASTLRNNIVLPASMDLNLGNLIKNLITADEHNRWGYGEVKHWCKNIYTPENFKQLNSISYKEKPINPLIYGKFNGETLAVVSLHQLALAIRNHWEQARNVLKRRDLIDFVMQFDRNLPTQIRELYKLRDVDFAVFRLLLLVDDDRRSIWFCGKEYRTTNEYFESLESGNDIIAQHFIKSGSLVYYFKSSNNDIEKVIQLEEFIRKNGCTDTIGIKALCFSMNGFAKFSLHNQVLNNLEEIIPILCDCSTEDINEILNNNDFISWMIALGYDDEIHIMERDYS